VLDVGRDIERIRDYLAGRLSEEESEAFGERLVRDPQLVRELERTLGLSEGLRQVARETRPAALPQPRRRYLWQPALAAAAAGVLAVALWVHPASERAPLLSASLPGGPTREAAAPSVTSQFTFVAMRGDGAPALELPRTGLIEFRVAAPSQSPAGGYRVTLLGAGSGDDRQPMGSAAIAALPADGYLHVYADAARLRPGHYVLNVSDGSGGAVLQAYPFSLGTGAATVP